MTGTNQLSLFADNFIHTVTISEAAIYLKVSTATIRNWIKTGYLEQTEKGLVTQDSLEKFKTKVAGQQKLIQRANKSQKDEHDHQKVAKDILKNLDIKNISTDILGSTYEASLSDSYRNQEGIYYTPKWIVDDLLNVDHSNLSNASFCDPCCGSGNFIIRALELGFKPENIYGYDVDPIAVELTKKRIYQQSNFASSNILAINFFDLVISTKQHKFDYIFTNPPWGKKIDKRQREHIGQYLNAGSSLDTCSLFFFACLSVLNDNGTLGFLLPDAFFNISVYEDARIRALSYQIERLIDYGKPFKGLLTKAQSITLSKQQPNKDNLVQCKNDKHTFERKQSSFEKNPKSILNLHCSQEDADVISYLFSIPHITLKNNADWGLGIVTGNNQKFIKNIPGPGLMPVFKGSDITENGLKTPSCYIPSDLSLYQQVAPIRFFEAPEKLIYKFISSNLCFFYDNQKRYVLNSANILIPNADFPVHPKVLADLLNSHFMNWLFFLIFNTHKVLRGDLEFLPIHAQFLVDEQFNESKFLDHLNIERVSNGAFRIKG